MQAPALGGRTCRLSLRTPTGPSGGSAPRRWVPANTDEHVNEVLSMVTSGASEDGSRDERDALHRRVASDE